MRTSFACDANPRCFPLAFPLHMGKGTGAWKSIWTFYGIINHFLNNSSTVQSILWCATRRSRVEASLDAESIQHPLCFHHSIRSCLNSGRLLVAAASLRQRGHNLLSTSERPVRTLCIIHHQWACLGESASAVCSPLPPTFTTLLTAAPALPAFWRKQSTRFTS